MGGGGGWGGGFTKVFLKVNFIECSTKSAQRQILLRVLQKSSRR